MPAYTHATNSYLNPRHAPMDFSEGAILLNTWKERYGAGRIDVPEKKLLFAVLQSAVMNIAGASFSGGRPRKQTLADWRQYQRLQDVAEDREWIADRTSWDCYSFNWIFSTLFPEWDLERARRSILENPELIRARIERLERLEAIDGLDEEEFDEEIPLWRHLTP